MVSSGVSDMTDTLDTRPKPFVFVLMPLAETFDDVYRLGIKPSCEDAGTYCERVDEQIFQESILQRIYNQIAKADIVVSDLTGRNPNVFYETGYAHALGKNVILLTQNVDDIPFDLKHYPHIVYGGRIVDLKAELKRRLRWYIDNPAPVPKLAPPTLEYYLFRVKIDGNSRVPVYVPDTSKSATSITFLFEVHNPSRQVFKQSTLEIGMILPHEFSEARGVSTVHLSDNRCMHIFKGIGPLLPGGWQALHFDIHFRWGQQIMKRKYSGILRLFGELGYEDITFAIGKRRRATTMSVKTEA